ncbi:MAG: hypothetical protein RSG77_26730 [Hafnia sp.]
MQVEAVVTRREKTTVTVNPKDIIEKYKVRWLAELKMVGCYINTEGTWEEWENTGHGSGLYTTHRKATEEEIKIADAFKTVLGLKIKDN